MQNDDSILVPRKPTGMTSVQAAQLYLEQQEQEANTFDMDALARAHLRRQLGFDFEVTIQRNRFICKDVTSDYKTTAFYNNMDEHAVKRLVRALMRLKKMHDGDIS